MATHTGRLATWHLTRVLRRTRTDTRPTLERGERVLATEGDAAAAPVMATTLALYHRAGPAEDPWHRLGWDEVGCVTWDSRRGVLDLTRVTPDATGGMTLTLPGRSRLVALARERVAATVVLSVRVPVCGRPALVMARRRHGSTDTRWIVQLSAGTDAQTAEVRAAIETALTHLRTTLPRPAHRP
jgi:hypothetical protein